MGPVRFQPVIFLARTIPPHFQDLERKLNGNLKFETFGSDAFKEGKKETFMSPIKEGGGGLALTCLTCPLKSRFFY